MEHPLSLTAVRPWRAAAIVAAAVATVELVVLVVVIAVMVAKPFADREQAAVRSAKGGAPAAAGTDRPAGSGAQSSAPAMAKLARSETSVVILNGNGVSGAADEASGIARSLTYLIAGTANAPRSDFRRSLVMYRPGFRGEAERLAKDLRVKRVAPLDGMRASDLLGAQVALILGRH